MSVGGIEVVHGKNGVAHVQEMRAPDPRHIRPDDLQTPEECAVTMSQIDDIICAITTQLDQAAADFNEEGIRADAGWMIAARHALKKFKIKRQAVQDRKGVLSRALKQAVHQAQENSWPQRFVDAAREVLDPKVFEQIIERMRP